MLTPRDPADAAFLGLERLADGGVAARARLDADPALKSRVDQSLAWLVEEGGAVSDALVALIAGLESEGPAILVIDMLEQGLDNRSWPAWAGSIAHRRRPGTSAGEPAPRSCDGDRGCAAAGLRCREPQRS